MVFAENLLAMLLAGGVDPRDAAWACDILPLIVTATAIETATHQALGADRGERQEIIAELTRTLAGMPRDRYPQLTSHIAEMTAGAGDDRFEFAIDVFLDGLVARSAARR